MKNSIQFYFGHFLKSIQVEMPVETKHKLNENMFLWRSERQRDFLYMLNFVFIEETHFNCGFTKNGFAL